MGLRETRGPGPTHRIAASGGVFSALKRHRVRVKPKCPVTRMGVRQMATMRACSYGLSTTSQQYFSDRTY
jgi:hypothetical protein